jgi:hypothetical protein
VTQAINSTVNIINVPSSAAAPRAVRHGAGYRVASSSGSSGTSAP